VRIWRIFSEALHRQTEINRHSSTVLHLRMLGLFLFPLDHLIFIIPMRMLLFFSAWVLVYGNAVVWGSCIVGFWHAISVARGKARER
jgi:hypothetical protein